MESRSAQSFTTKTAVAVTSLTPFFLHLATVSDAVAGFYTVHTSSRHTPEHYSPSVIRVSEFPYDLVNPTRKYYTEAKWRAVRQ